jgi:hypothetical protein
VATAVSFGAVGGPPSSNVKLETVIGWRRQAFRWFWTSKLRHGQPRASVGVPRNSATDSQDEPRKALPGAPRIQGELLKLILDIGKTSMSKYLLRPRQAAVPELADLL